MQPWVYGDLVLEEMGLQGHQPAVLEVLRELHEMGYLGGTLEVGRDAPVDMSVTRAGKILLGG